MALYDAYLGLQMVIVGYDILQQLNTLDARVLLAHARLQRMLLDDRHGLLEQRYRNGFGLVQGQLEQREHIGKARFRQMRALAL